MSKQIPLLFSCFFLLLNTSSLHSQINYTANDTVPPYTQPFGYGSNMGWYHPWSDKELADIAVGNPDMNIRGLGVTALRPALPEHFVEEHGYDVRLEEFQHYFDIGTRNNTVFIGYPSGEHRDTTPYCPTSSNKTFANLYTPIWDGGANGTPVNDTNYMALYLYRIVSMYGENIRFWEVWNEPDFDYTGHAWRPPGEDGNWWENDPPPCQNAIRAPIFHYVRMLRISYEVIKTLRPDTYVAIGGLGYPSFLDAVCRNTDNPVDGSIAAGYPLRGGAYFDCMSFHSYPHIDGSLRQWNHPLGSFIYSRHSDKAVDGVLQLYNEFKEVLKTYGYGLVYPQKEYIITESNIPRVVFDNYIGSDEAQRNYMMKALVSVQQVGIRQFCVYDLGETQDVDTAHTEFKLMGLYKNLNAAPPYQREVNPSGIAFATTSTLLRNTVYDPTQTALLNLGPEVRGGAFATDSSDYVYVLWAATQIDQSEAANHTFMFPPILQADSLQIYAWDHYETGAFHTQPGPAIALTGSPVFIRVKKDNPPPPVLPEKINLSCHPNPFYDSMQIDVFLPTEEQVQLSIYDTEGRLVTQLLPQSLLPPGEHQYTVGQSLPSGVYICKMKTAKRKFFCKFVKTKE